MNQIARPRAFLVAPDSFKGTFTAPEVAAAIGRGLEAAGGRSDLCPLADGGEGTVEVLGAERIPAAVHDPLGREITAAWGQLSEGRAVVEIAEASGLELVREPERDAEAASSSGTGELILAAAASGASAVLVAAGGSATTDGGAGAIAAIRDGGGLGGVSLEVLCDVTTPFEDAARVFAPQKGADAAAVGRLTARLDGLAGELARDPRGVPMSGAAGGLAGGLWAEFGAELRPGAGFVLDAVEFERRLSSADAVISGEGRVDSQSVEGKVVGEVARRCRDAGVALHVVAGSIAAGFQAAELPAESMREASTLAELEAAGAALAAYPQ